MKTKLKLLAAILILVAATIHLVNSGYRDWNSGGDLAYVLGFLFLFFTKESVEDERVRALKLKALTVAFAVGYVATVVSKLWLNSRPDFPRAISAFDFMLVVLVTAFAQFHYWQWRDGRPERMKRQTRV